MTNWFIISQFRKMSTFIDKIDGQEVCFKNAIIVVSIPKDVDWTHPVTGEKRAYKFVSRVFGGK